METCVWGRGACQETKLVPSHQDPEERRFCQPHQEFLNRHREEMENASHKRSHRNKKDATKLVCSTEDCHNRPLVGSEFCFDCEEMAVA